ncbi:TspO/MBR family protein [Rhizobium rhizoryzae]|uniref:Tryptophan-rich sensory protein n=1 Tax=Rhizobium rhizoryzae TaxID=451876 RepID=A0A7W6LIA6_9HYPH|nr:TspO/MBR family protein [Rhizobium rhizoryzae]MBB4143531.1 tryptophan-rich sensory protein [Rhizobium rhizoryzae]
MKKILIHVLFVAVVVGLGALIGIANIPGEWYQALNKPPFNPPNWIFGPVWTTLYVLIGIAGARTWLDSPSSSRMQIWFGQMVLNFLWSPAFFGMESTVLGLIVIIPMLVLIVLFIQRSWNKDRISALLFLPYIAWVSFATLLNLSLFILN